MEYDDDVVCIGDLHKKNLTGRKQWNIRRFALVGSFLVYYKQGAKRGEWDISGCTVRKTTPEECNQPAAKTKDAANRRAEKFALWRQKKTRPQTTYFSSHHNMRRRDDSTFRRRDHHQTDRRQTHRHNKVSAWSLRRHIRHWNDIAAAQLTETTRRRLGGLSCIFQRIPTFNLSRQVVELKKLGGGMLNRSVKYMGAEDSCSLSN